MPPPVDASRRCSSIAWRQDRASRPPSRAGHRARSRFQYTALSFAAPARVRFRYQLDGFDPDWVDAGARRTAFYTNVPPGRTSSGSRPQRRWRVGRDRRRATRGAAAALLSDAPGSSALARARRARRRLRRRCGCACAQLRGRASSARARAGRRAHRASCERSARSGGRSLAAQVGVPRQRQPRDPHADERRHRHDRSRARCAARRREVREYLETVRSSADALLHVINDILDFSKIEAGKLELEPTHFDLRDARRTTCSALLAPARGRQGPAAHRPCRAPTCRRTSSATPIRLRQVLINLVGNALKFTDEGEVAVTVDLDAVDAPPAMPRGRSACASRSSTPASASRPNDQRAHLRGVHAGRRLGDAQVRRHRPGPGDLGAAGAADGRPSCTVDSEPGRAAARSRSRPGSASTRRGAGAAGRAAAGRARRARRARGAGRRGQPGQPAAGEPPAREGRPPRHHRRQRRAPRSTRCARGASTSC